MSVSAAPDDESEDEPIPLKTLLGALAVDAKAFARAEANYLKASAGARAQYAVPGVVLLVTALALVTGVVVALPVGLLLILAPIIGAGWAIAAVVAAFLLVSGILGLIGFKRIKSAMKGPFRR